jgi:hypothetical protein
VFIFLLNSSPLSRVGLSIELPIGWQIAEPVVCADGLPDTTEAPCDAVCDQPDRHSEGLPFAWNRPGQSYDCGTDINKLAQYVNALTGAVLGVLYIFLAGRHWTHKRSKTP